MRFGKKGWVLDYLVDWGDWVVWGLVRDVVQGLGKEERDNQQIVRHWFFLEELGEGQMRAALANVLDPFIRTDSAMPLYASDCNWPTSKIIEGKNCVLTITATFLFCFVFKDWHGTLTWLAISVAFLALRKSGVSLAMAFRPLPLTSSSRSLLYSFYRSMKRNVS